MCYFYKLILKKAMAELSEMLHPAKLRKTAGWLKLYIRNMRVTFSSLHLCWLFFFLYIYLFLFIISTFLLLLYLFLLLRSLKLRPDSYLTQISQKQLSPVATKVGNCRQLKALSSWLSEFFLPFVMSFVFPWPVWLYYLGHWCLRV